MGVITRESSAPITDNEAMLAADVENEFAKIFTLMNGGIDTTNLAPAAGILGTQIADATIPNGKLTASTITTTQMAASAVPKHGFSTFDNTGDLTDSDTLVDVPGVSSVTLTPGSLNDVIVLTLAVSVGAGAGPQNYSWGFNISDGTGDVTTGYTTLNTSINRDNTWTIQHVMNPLLTTATVYKPRYKASIGSANTGVWLSAIGLDYTCRFDVLINPIKS